MKLIVSLYEGHLRSSGKSVVFPKRGKKLSKVYIFRIINILSINQSRDHLDTSHVHVQDICEFGPCHDSGRKSKAQNV